MEWALLGVVIICAVALVIVSCKRRALERDLYVSTKIEADKAHLSEEKDGTEKNIQKTQPDEPQSLHSIYRYVSPSVKCICLNCDGENDPTEQYCHICGERMNRRGVK